MDARLVSEAEVTVPLQGKGLGAAEIAADPEVCCVDPQFDSKDCG
jgi:hypothetical protein